MNTNEGLPLQWQRHLRSQGHNIMKRCARRIGDTLDAAAKLKSLQGDFRKMAIDGLNRNSNSHNFGFSIGFEPYRFDAYVDTQPTVKAYTSFSYPLPGSLEIPFIYGVTITTPKQNVIEVVWGETISLPSDVDDSPAQIILKASFGNDGKLDKDQLLVQVKNKTRTQEINDLMWESSNGHTAIIPVVNNHELVRPLDVPMWTIPDIINVSGLEQLLEKPVDYFQNRFHDEMFGSINKKAD